MQFYHSLVKIAIAITIEIHENVFYSITVQLFLRVLPLFLRPSFLEFHHIHQRYLANLETELTVLIKYKCSKLM